jgi:putative ABC transport system ATP-binding protein
MEPSAQASRAQPLICFRGITKNFGMGLATFQALRGVDLGIFAGEFVAVMGPSGSGKSTAMNIMGCLDTPSGGSYRLDGVEINGLSEEVLAQIRRAMFGFVFQGYNLLPRATALENVELPLRYRGVSAALRREVALRTLDRVGLKGWEQHRPSEMSGGQQQRVAIARAIATDPPIVLADEPTGNLDSARRREIMDLLVDINQDANITVVMVTHETDCADRAQRTLWFEDGRVIDHPQAQGLTPQVL